MIDLELINKFLNNKNITHPIIRETVTKFIVEHTQQFSSVVSEEMLIKRLEENLDRIVLEDPENRIGQSVVGVYEGFDRKQITMFFTESHLQNEQLRKDFINILLHELTHASYTIRNNDIYNSENHIFGTRIKLADGRVDLSSGNDSLMEPIVNFISTKLHIGSTGAYVSTTHQLDRLSQIIGTDIIVDSAWSSNETKLQESFSIFNTLDPYGRFKRGISSLSSRYSDDNIEYINKIFATANKNPQVDNKRQIQMLKEFRETLTPLQPLNVEDIGAKKGF